MLFPVVFFAGLTRGRVGVERVADLADPEMARAASGRAADRVADRVAGRVAGRVADRAGAFGVATFRAFPTDRIAFGFAAGALTLVETDFEPGATAAFFGIGAVPRREGAATGLVTDARPPEAERAATRGAAALADRGLVDVRETAFTFRSVGTIAALDRLAARVAAGVSWPFASPEAPREPPADFLAGALEALVLVRGRVVELRDAGVMARTTAGFAPAVPGSFGAVPGLAPTAFELGRAARDLALPSGERPEISTFDVTPVA